LDESGNIYYLNQVSNETTWERPYVQNKKEKKEKTAEEKKMKAELRAKESKEQNRRTRKT